MPPDERTGMLQKSRWNNVPRNWRPLVEAMGVQPENGGFFLVRFANELNLELLSPREFEKLSLERVSKIDWWTELNG